MKRAQMAREARYQAALSSYAQVLKPGMTRKDVENYLRQKGIKPYQMCCIQEYSALADIIQIGEEAGDSWVCTKWLVYVAFVFRATEPHDAMVSSDSDTLTRITIHREGKCL